MNEHEEALQYVSAALLALMSEQGKSEFILTPEVYDSILQDVGSCGVVTLAKNIDGHIVVKIKQLTDTFNKQTHCAPESVQ